MTTTTTLVKLIAEDIELMNREWSEGRATSPSELDYVISADRILTAAMPDYIGSVPEGREFVADVLFEDCGETYVTPTDIATYLVNELTAE